MSTDKQILLLKGFDKEMEGEKPGEHEKKHAS